MMEVGCGASWPKRAMVMRSVLLLPMPSVLGGVRPLNSMKILSVIVASAVDLLGAPSAFAAAGRVGKMMEEVVMRVVARVEDAMDVKKLRRVGLSVRENDESDPSFSM